MTARGGAVITGGGRGVGAAVAARLVQREIPVVLAARTRDELEATAETLRRAHPMAHITTVVCDVASAVAVDALAEATRRALPDGVDLLVNNAGIVRRALAHEMDEATWDAVIDVNLKGAWLCTRAFIPAMLVRRSGRVVNVSSISATIGSPRASAYNASKWGLVGFTKSVAEETRELGVQVMAVLPGSIDTEMLQGSGYTPQMSADDVARTIEWLGLDAPAAMHGSAVEMFG